MEQPVPQPQIALPNVPSNGDVIAGKYRVEGILGVGGMGVVLGARHLQLGQLVAIKVLTVEGDHQDDAIERFLREGRAAASLSSDHVVRIYDVGQLPSGVPFMVMERLRGRDLATILSEEGPLRVADSVEYIAQAAVAIAEAHEVGIVHRDLKPANLFLTQRSDGTACVKILDFGISKQLTDLEAPTLRSALTSTRQVMGSPAYMSPEQVRDAKTVDHRTDIWALGVTLYELLTQHAAFDADTLPAVCAAIVADPPVPLRNRRPEIPEALETIVFRCLEKVPTHRYPSARALLGALRSFQGKVIDSRATHHGSEGKVPLTANSADLQVTRLPDRTPNPELIESGPRSVEPDPVDPTYGTLISARNPKQAQAVGPSPAASAASLTDTPQPTPAGERPDVPPPKPSNSMAARTSRAAVASIAFVLIGAATIGLLLNRSRSARMGESVQVDPSSSKTSKTRFTLRIESNPSQASVLESGNPIGVTPLTLEIERSIVQRSARQFLLRKRGFTEVTIQQGDSSEDVKQNVILAKTLPLPEVTSAIMSDNPSTADVNRRRSATKSGAVRTVATSSPAPSSSAPGIRTAR